MPAQPFHLREVTLRNYRSIAAAHVELGPLLVLVGPNGSGKSNFLDALRLVSESLESSLDQALRSRGGVNEVRRRSTGHPNHFAIDLQFEGATFSGTYGFEIASARNGGFRVAREECSLWLAEHDAEGERLADVRFLVENGELVKSTQPVMPPVSPDRLYLVAAAGISDFRKAYDGLSAINVYSFNPDVMRQPQTPDAGAVLRRDGSNIASVLHALWQHSAAGERERIESYLQQIVPGMHGVTRSALGSWETLVFSQDVPGSKNPWKFSANSVSDGTLRALGILVSLFAASGDVVGPVGIEEPESALHPAATAVLLDALRDASERRQVIVTSHSPDLLDREDFELSQIRAVRAFRGETLIGELDAAGALALRERLFTPGELLRNDQLIPATSGPIR